MANVELKTGYIKSENRVNRLREKMLVTPSLCIERGYLITESYKETESEPAVVRRAKALEKILKEMTITIADDELIVGKATSKMRGGVLIPEVNWRWYLEELDRISTRDYDRFSPLTEDEKTKMKSFLPYWAGRSLYDKWHASIPEDLVKPSHYFYVPVSSCANNQHLAHNAPDYEKVLAKGLNGIKQEVEGELMNLNLSKIADFRRFQFLKAVKITLRATINFAKRYSNLARDLADKEVNEQRKDELLKIADTCHWVPANPARSFYEALQSVWFIYITLMIEGWGPGICFGRPDQYLYSFYIRDIQTGKITDEEVKELIALFYINMNGLVTPLGSEVVETIAGFPIWPNVTLGGITKEGKNAVNDLSYLFLEAEEDVRLTSEELIIRVHRNNPESFLLKACEIAALVKGKLKFVGDETTIQTLINSGKTVENARDYIIVGCFIPTISASSHDIPGGMLNLPLMLELALNNGASRLTGEQIGLETGDPKEFKSYSDVWNAYKRQVEAKVPVLAFFRSVDRQLFAEFVPTPFQSALFNGCIQKGIDITSGGTAPYISQALGLGAIPNVGDSLAAIKKAVFEDSKVSMHELIEALDKNFDGKTEILKILDSCPKFGNDDDYVDTIVNEVLVHASNEVAKYIGFAGAISTSGAGLSTANIPLGYEVGALPDGRKAGEPLSEGGISPYQGRNISGPTSTMRSVAKLDSLKLAGGSVLNMKFSPELLKDKSKIRKFASLIRTFFETGGYLVQFNIVSTDMLRDAQKHPQKYRDLLVRVATYSAYFVELGKELQDDIIARTEFQEV